MPRGKLMRFTDLEKETALWKVIRLMNEGKTRDQAVRQVGISIYYLFNHMKTASNETQKAYKEAAEKSRKRGIDKSRRS